MRTKLIGLFILAAVIIAAAAYAMFTRKPEVTQINGMWAARRSVCWRIRRLRKYWKKSIICGWITPRRDRWK